MVKMSRLFALILSATISTPAFAADETQNTVYLGAGPSDENGALATDDTPYVIGFLNSSSARSTIWGFDLAGEGAMFDSTGGGERVRQALSFNLLVGTNVYQTSDLRVDAIGILGAREAVSDCADSYLGYQCYADTSPDTQYEVNYGGMINATFDRYMVGVRATGVSTQIVFGLQF